MATGLATAAAVLVPGDLERSSCRDLGPEQLALGIGITYRAPEFACDRCWDLTDGGDQADLEMASLLQTGQSTTPPLRSSLVRGTSLSSWPAQLAILIAVTAVGCGSQQSSDIAAGREADQQADGAESGGSDSSAPTGAPKYEWGLPWPVLEIRRTDSGDTFEIILDDVPVPDGSDLCGAGAYASEVSHAQARHPRWHRRPRLTKAGHDRDNRVRRKMGDRPSRLRRGCLSRHR